MGGVEREGGALGVEGRMVTALCHAAGGCALGAADAGVGTAVLGGRRVGGHGLAFGQTTWAS